MQTLCKFQSLTNTLHAMYCQNKTHFVQQLTKSAALEIMSQTSISVHVMILTYMHELLYQQSKTLLCCGKEGNNSALPIPRNTTFRFI